MILVPAQVYSEISEEPVAAASLGQVRTGARLWPWLQL